jgi:hypothetical protein
MVSTAASAGKNSESRQDADFKGTNVQVIGPGVPEISASRSETMSDGVLKKRVLIRREPGGSLRLTCLKGGLFASRELIRSDSCLPAFLAELAHRLFVDAR